MSIRDFHDCLREIADASVWDDPVRKLGDKSSAIGQIVATALQKTGIDTPAQTPEKIADSIVKWISENAKLLEQRDLPSLNKIQEALITHFPKQPELSTIPEYSHLSDAGKKEQIEALSKELDTLLQNPKCAILHEHGSRGFLMYLNDLRDLIISSPPDPRFFNQQMECLRGCMTDLEVLLARPPKEIKERLKTTKKIEDNIEHIFRGSSARLSCQDLIAAVRSMEWKYCNSLQTLLHSTALQDVLNPDASAVLRACIKKMNINARDDNGNTPLLWAVANASANSALILVEYPTLDCDIQDWGYNGLTALQLAIAKGRRTSNWDELVTELIQLTQLDLPNKDGNTALHLAYARRDEKWINDLIAAGASQSIRNNAGQTPAELWDLDNDAAYALMNPHPDTTTWDVDARNQANRDAIRT